MSTPIDNSKTRFRDGTSQAARRLKALRPDYVQVDERSLEDFLAFAREYAKELNFYDENNELQEGCWTGFIDSEMDLAQAAAYAQDPQAMASAEARMFARPHFALFLSFLKLLANAQQHMNGFTRRHLEFYYEKSLGMTKKASVADQVNVLLRASAKVAETEVPARHLLAAGRDSLGRDRFYSTDRRIVVNHAGIGRLSAVYAHRETTGIKEAREQHKGTREEAILRMLEVTLGEPLPGDPLPEYEPGKVIDYAALLRLESLVNFTKDGLFLEFFELRDLMRLKQQREDADNEWAQINAKLEAIGKARTGDPGFRLAPQDPRDFDANLVKALGGAPSFAGLPQVENIDDLYQQRTRQDIKDYISDPTTLPQSLKSLESIFTRFQDFESMMLIKVKIDKEWNEINRILEKAGREKREDPGYRLVPDDATGFDPTDFAENFEAALGTVDFSAHGAANLDDYYAALLQLEAYFYMPAEHFAYLMNLAGRQEDDIREGEWEKVYEFLATAYRNKVFAKRREKLKEVREAESDMMQGFNAMLSYALGQEPDVDSASVLSQLQEYVQSAADYKELESAEKKLQAGDAGEISWSRVYRIVELAQRQRERLSEPVPHAVKWINLHAYGDVTTEQITGDEANPRWKTFGSVVPKADEHNPPEETFGWAVASPLLVLSGGARRVVLTCGFEPEGYDAAKIESLFPKGRVSAIDDTGPFRIRMTTHEGWLSPDTIEVNFGSYKTLSGLTGAVDSSLIGLQFVLEFSEQLDAITAPAEGERIESVWPVLALMLRQCWDAASGQYITHYVPFQPLELATVHLQVKVGRKEATAPSGLSEFHIQNDQTILDCSKPVHPFGTSPAVGSRFYIGHPELVHKRLDSLSFGIEWMGGPEDLKAHYSNYAAGNSEWEFKTRVSLVDKRVNYKLIDASLFMKNDASKANTIDIDDIPASLKSTNAAYVYRRSLDVPSGDNLLRWHRYLQWELTPLDFQHQTYPAVAAQKSVEMAAAIANKDPDPITPESYKVSPPYTPKIKKLDLHYSASLEINVSEYNTRQSDDQVFHVHPFGYHEVQVQAKHDSCPFMPEYTAEGELYLGITNANPPQHLSVLFQMAEGSANPDLEPARVEWCYLSGDQWLSLADGGIHLDTTRGLINTGIIEFELRQAQPSTRMPKGFYWLRASIARNSDSVCDTVAVHTQAVSATLIDNRYAPDHYTRPLPEKKITGLSPPIPGVAEVLQPYTSFGGKPQEQESIFYTRVSERLRHKQRALTSWDYERLVLEQFPQIYKVKCLSADAAGIPGDAGKLSIIVIPDVRGRLPFDPFEPKAPADLIATIEGFLADKTPPFARVEVRNAHYVPVKVRVGVRFKPGYDIGFYRQRLIDELNQFLSPWAYDAGADIVIGGRIYANSIINFLDQREYVDYVAAIKLFSSEDGRNFRLAQPDDTQGYFVATQSPDGVLVAARSHEIDVIEEGGYEEEQFTGINYMKVELDFVVG